MNRRYTFNISSLLFILAVAVWAVGCASSENKTTNTATTSPSPAASAMASPAATVAEAKVDLAGGLASTKEHLGMAATELKNKNTKGAVDHIGMAHKEIITISDKAPANVKAAIEAAGKQIETAKGLIEKHDATASAALEKATDLVSKASDLAKSSSMAEGAKGMVGGAMKSGAESTKPAATKQPEKK